MENNEEQRDLLRAKLDALGVKYHHRSGVESLQKLLDEHTTEQTVQTEQTEQLGQHEQIVENELRVECALTEQQKNIAESIMHTGSNEALESAAEYIDNATPVTGGHLSENGIYLPHEATKHIRHRNKVYEIEEVAGESVVFRNGKELRRYTEAIHGDEYRELAKMFVRKQEMYRR